MGLFIGIIIGLIVVSVILFFTIRMNVKKISSDEKEIVVLKNDIGNSFPRIQIVEDNKIIPSEKNKIIDSNIKNRL